MYVLDSIYCANTLANVSLIACITIATAQAPGSATLLSTALVYAARPTLAVKFLVSWAARSVTNASSFQSSDVKLSLEHFDFIKSTAGISASNKLLSPGCTRAYDSTDCIPASNASQRLWIIFPGWVGNDNCLAVAAKNNPQTRKKQGHDF